jgi:hypothetical protein
VSWLVLRHYFGIMLKRTSSMIQYLSQSDIMVAVQNRCLHRVCRLAVTQNSVIGDAVRKYRRGSAEREGKVRVLAHHDNITVKVAVLWNVMPCMVDPS